MTSGRVEIQASPPGRQDAADQTQGGRAINGKEKRGRLISDGKKISADIRNSPTPLTTFVARWKQFWNAGFDLPYKPELAEGDVLKELTREDESAPITPFTAMGKDTAWASTDDKKEAALLLMACLMSIWPEIELEDEGMPNMPESKDNMVAKALLEILAPRMEGLPSTVGDVATFHIVRRACLSFNSLPRISDGDFKNWLLLAKGKNPVVRLTALRAFSEFMASEEQVSQFFEVFASDSEDLLAQEAVRLLRERVRGHDDELCLKVQEQMRNAAPVGSKRRDVIVDAMKK